MDSGLVLVAQTSVCGVPLELAEMPLDLSAVFGGVWPVDLGLREQPGLAEGIPQTEVCATKSAHYFFGTMGTSRKGCRSFPLCRHCHPRKNFSWTIGGIVMQKRAAASKFILTGNLKVFSPRQACS